MDVIIRPMKPEEYPRLADFLYEAIFQRDESNPLPREVISEPALKVYIEDFGEREDDYCLCAQVGETLAGAVWVRNIPGYGSVDGETPEFAISLFREFRGGGLGTRLMERMLTHLERAGYQKASLAVQKDNYAVKMYRSLGFQTVDENPEEYIMVYDFVKGAGRTEK